MTGDGALAGVFGLVTGGAIAVLGARSLLAGPPGRLVRRNYRDRTVPAVLGISIVMGGAVGSGVAAVIRLALGDVFLATILVVVVMGVGGAIDDLRGDEKAKGFRGHIRAALRGRITGGFIKIVAGAFAGLVAGFIVTSGRAAIEIALLVALTANLVNLLDRAPGRAIKGSLAAAVSVVIVGPAAWISASAAVWGATLAVLPLDLRERAMLGDAGANAIGGVLGLGLGLALGEPGRLVALLIVLALNLASERWSFSAVIESNRALRAFDRLGRTRH